jgi:sigma-B regulation protein RsbU (phosphoserine phosphatase)
MSKLKILIVDDEPFNVDYIEQELEDSDYETISAGNGQEALEKVQLESPDLMLLDIMMPVMDGFEVLKQLKANPETRDMPVIVISASNDLKSVVRGIKLGAEDYLPKPFEPTLLSARISSSLEKKQLRDLQKLYLKSLERELEIGREIQMGFLPPQLPTVEGWEMAAYFKAAREVAGDYYDAFILPDGNLACVVGDVVGKGVGAALYMSLFRSLIRATAQSEHFLHPPRAEKPGNMEHLLHVVSSVNDYVAETHGHTSMFSTIFICFIDLQEHLLTYINGGNEPAIFVKNNGEMRLLWPTGPIVGVIPQAEFGVEKLAFGENELLLVYSDGVTDALNNHEEAFGRERLTELLIGEHSQSARVLQRIEERLQQYVGGAVQFDDITALAVKRLG